ncbi:MAG: hypothetical protein PVG25_13305 [Anaerolineae bacterium]|jgi:hypothetical protein
MAKLKLPRRGAPVSRLTLFVLVLIVSLLLTRGAQSAGTPLNRDSKPSGSWSDPASALAPLTKKNISEGAGTAVGTFARSVDEDFVIDGRADDWNAKAPAAVDPSGDSLCGAGTDLTSVYYAWTPDYLYIMQELADSSAGEGWFHFHIDKEGGTVQHYVVDLSGTSCTLRNEDTWAEIGHPSGVADVVAEVAIPRAMLESPQLVRLWPVALAPGTGACDDFSSSHDISPTWVDLEYTLTIDDPSSGQATVDIAVSDLSGDILEVEEHGYHGLYVDVMTLSARDETGNGLSVAHRPDSGTSYHDQRADVWRINCNGLDELSIEYTVRPGLIDSMDSHRGYIAGDFAVFAGENVFLVPKNTAVESIAVTFNLPAGWQAYTPWAFEDNAYDPALPEAPLIDSLSISDIALGQFDVYTRTVGTTEVAVVFDILKGDHPAEF